MDVSANKGVGDDAYVIGVDFGTLSARALVVRVRDGAEAGTAVSEYSRGVIDRSLDGHGELPPDWALQDPADYTRALGQAVPAAVRDAGIDPAQVIGIATDFTASTCMPVLADGTPLCQLPGLAGRPHAYPKLWKHHAAQPHADRINAVAHERGEKWINRYGGKISSEWQFAKALQLLDEDPEMYQRADRWIEAADWIIWQLCGTETRNACTAGYKGIYQDGAYPSREYLAALDPRFASFAQDKLAHPVSPLGARAGGLTAAAAALTGLPEGIAVAIGNVDAHVTVPAAGPVAPGKMVAIMGTSTCHVMNGAELAEVPGMCGVVDGGIVAGLWGYEAGQSGVGDIFAWFTANAVPGEFAGEASPAGRAGAATAGREGGRAAGRRPRARRAGLGGRQPFGPGRRQAVRRDRGPDAGHHHAGDLPGAAGVDRVRHPDDHGYVPRLRRASDRPRGGGRPDQERTAHADLRGRHPAPAQRDRVRAGAGPRFGHPRGGRRGCLPGRAGRGGGDGARAAGRVPARSRPRGRVRRAVRGVRAAARLLRPGREQGHVPAAGDQGPCPVREDSMNSSVAAVLRDEVLHANQAIPRARLATLTWGNVSGIDRDAGVYVIKPSGVSYDDLTAEQLVVVDLEDGRVVDGHLRPSVDSETHRRLYLAFGGVGGITHTHSPSAVAFAQAKRDIPVLGTTHADAFNGPIRCTRDLTEAECATDYEYNTGQVIVEEFDSHRDDPAEVPGALVANHGPFVWGEDAGASLKNAIICEAVAQMAIQTLALNPHADAPPYLLERHFRRKHGPDAYYGNPQAGQGAQR